MIKISEADIEETLEIYEDFGLRISAQSKKIICLELLQDSYRVLTGDNKGFIHIWDLNDYQMIDKWRAHENWVYQISSSIKCKKIVSSSEDRSIKFWDWFSYLHLFSITLEVAVFFSKMIPELNLIISGCKWGQLKFFDLDTLAERESFKVSHREIWNISISLSEGIFALACFDKKSFLYNIHHRLQLAINNHLTMVTSVVIVDHLRCYLTGELNGLLIQFSFFEGKKIQVSAHQDSIRHLVLNDTKDKVFTASSDSFIKVFNVDNLELLTSVKAHSNYVNWLAYEENTEVLISSSWDGSIKVFNSHDLTVKGKFLNHVACVRGMILWNDSRFCISYDEEGYLKLWNLKIRKFVADLYKWKDFNIDKVLTLKKVFLVADKRNFLIVFKNDLLL